MKCPSCKKDMMKINNVGRYWCNDCKLGFDDLVYREENKQDDLGQTFISKNISSLPPQQYGWVCPKCGAVMSPSQNTCPYCSPPYIIKTYY